MPPLFTPFAAPPRPRTGLPLRSILRQPAFPRKRRSKPRVQRRLGMLHRSCATASSIEVVLTRATKGARSGVTATCIAQVVQRVHRPTNTRELSSPSCRLTIKVERHAAASAPVDSNSSFAFDPPCPHSPPPRDRSNRLLDCRAMPASQLPVNNTDELTPERQAPQRLDRQARDQRPAQPAQYCATAHVSAPRLRSQPEPSRSVLPSVAASCAEL